MDLGLKTLQKNCSLYDKIIIFISESEAQKADLFRRRRRHAFFRHRVHHLDRLLNKTFHFDHFLRKNISSFGLLSGQNASLDHFLNKTFHLDYVLIKMFPWITS